MRGNRYSFHIEWSNEDQEYIATCPAFPGLSAFGETEEKALKEAKIALAGFIETYKANNMLLPAPKLRESVSGKFQLRLPKTLHHLAVRLAHLDGVSLNSYIADAVRGKVAGDQVGNRVLNEIRELIAQTQTATAAGSQATKHTAKGSLTEKTIFVTTPAMKTTDLPKPHKPTRRHRKNGRHPHTDSSRKA